ncbi:MAG: hypothetical protein ACR2GY_08195 [Phycisphaerales bacterium]
MQPTASTSNDLPTDASPSEQATTPAPRKRGGLPFSIKSMGLALGSMILSDEVKRLKADALNTKGAASGADFWLGLGESVTIVEPGNTFSLQYVDVYKQVRINANGEVKVLAVGDSAAYTIEGVTWQVIYKQVPRQSDKRAGFDLARQAAKQGE